MRRIEEEEKENGKTLRREKNDIYTVEGYMKKEIQRKRWKEEKGGTDKAGI